MGVSARIARRLQIEQVRVLLVVQSMKRVTAKQAASRLLASNDDHRSATPWRGVPVTSGSYEAADWMHARGLDTPASTRWYAEIVLDVVDRRPDQLWSGVADSRFHLYLYPSEWSYFFCHAGRASWIRIAERAVVHGRDDFGLVGSTPRLADVGRFLNNLEHQHRVRFRREHALVRTSAHDSEQTIRHWLAAL